MAVMDASAETINGIEGIEVIEKAEGLLDPRTVPEAIAAIKTLEELGGGSMRLGPI